MDRRERFENLIVAVRALIHQTQADLWTALPGEVQSYNSVANTVSVQPLIMGQIRQQTGPNTDENWVDVKLPILVDCPVQFPSGGGYLLTFPLVKGTEGIIIISSRCLDAWWQLGGVQKQLENRLHDLSDAMFIPGIFSVPKVPSGISTTDVQLRDTTGTTAFGISPTTGPYINAPGAGLTVNGKLTVTDQVIAASGVSCTGNITATGEVTAGLGTADAVGLQTHLHSGIRTGTSNTEAPVPGT